MSFFLINFEILINVFLYSNGNLALYLLVKLKLIEILIPSGTLRRTYAAYSSPLDGVREKIAGFIIRKKKNRHRHVVLLIDHGLNYRAEEEAKWEGERIRLNDGR
jgi:hypothetical protein